MNLLEVKNISKTYGNGETAVKALKDVSFSVPKGEYVAIVGESGSGKSTLLNMIGALDTPTSGKVLIDGKDIFAMNDRKLTVFRRRNIGFIFQAFNLIPELTVEQNIIFPLLLDYQKPDKRYLEELLTVLNLKDRRNHLPSQLSGGQQQRVALARALVMRPGLLLLDEPLSNLDAKLRESMRFEISSIQKELGITVIYVTHDQSEAMTMSDRVVVMSRGVIQQIGTPYEIYRNPANKMVADFIGLVNFVEGEVQGDRVYISGTGVSFPNTSGITGSATIAVRPENITMSRTSGTIEGTLVHRFYLGDAVDYRVQCKHHVIRVIVKGAELKEFTDGEKVYLDFDKIMVFDRD